MIYSAVNLRLKVESVVAKCQGFQKISMAMKPFSENPDNPCLLKFPYQMEGRNLCQKKEEGFSWYFNIQHYILLCAVLSTPQLHRFCLILLSSDGVLLKYTSFFFLWFVCYFVSQYLLSQFTAVLVTAGAASKYLILFTQYWSRSSWWTCHEAHNLYCNRACYATFWKA